VTTLYNKTGQPIGRLWNGPDFRLLFLSGVTGAAADGSLANDPSQQAAAMFRNADARLALGGFSYAQVARTWIYLARLLDWYGDFNHARTDFYRLIGFDGCSDATAFPASTGIQGRTGDEECVMDLLALDSAPDAGVIARPVRRTARQDQPFTYGSAFSRAMVIEAKRENKRTIYCSGTASINAAGETTHVGDPEGQCHEMLDCLAAILREQGAGFEHICHATLFCKTEQVYDVYRQVASARRLPQFPLVSVRADICRPDLLVEMELTAVV